MLKVIFHVASSIFIYLVLSSSALSSEAIRQGKVTLDNSSRHSLYSEKIDQTFFIDVIVPQSYVSGENNYPVLYITDGNPLFQLVASNTLLLELGGLPESIVVGISYDGTFMDQLYLRERDLTPTIDEQWNKLAHEAGILSEDISSGGADEFLEFLLNDVKTLINDNFRTLNESESLLGHSDGGLFALYVLFSNPESFENYIVSSPGTGWDSGAIFNIEEKFSKSRDDLDSNLFLSVGALEIETEIHTRRLYETLRSHNFPNLEIEYHIFENETHTSVVGTALNRGIRYIYGLD